MDQEKHAKDASSQETRMRLAGFPVKKRLEDFDFEFQPSIDKAVYLRPCLVEIRL